MKQGELVKRGFFNNKVVNDQFLEAQREKFKKPQSEFDTEKMLKAIKPRDVVKRNEIKKYLQRNIDEYNNAGKKALAAAYTKWIAQFDMESVETQIDAEFTVDFQKWLLGVGKHEDHQRTPWGKQRVADKECNAYLSVFLDARFEFTNKLQEMLYKAKGLGGLEGIEEYYMFFKYIVRGGWENPALFADWLSEWRSWSKLRPDAKSKNDPGLPIDIYKKDTTTERDELKKIERAIEKSVTGEDSSLVGAKSATVEQIDRERAIVPKTVDSVIVVPNVNPNPNPTPNPIVIPSPPDRSETILNEIDQVKQIAASIETEVQKIDQVEQKINALTGHVSKEHVSTNQLILTETSKIAAQTANLVDLKLQGWLTPRMDAIQNSVAGVVNQLSTQALLLKAINEKADISNKGIGDVLKDVTVLKSKADSIIDKQDKSLESTLQAISELSSDQKAGFFAQTLASQQILNEVLINKANIKGIANQLITINRATAHTNRTMLSVRNNLQKLLESGSLTAGQEDSAKKLLQTQADLDDLKRKYDVLQGNAQLNNHNDVATVQKLETELAKVKQEATTKISQLDSEIASLQITISRQSENITGLNQRIGELKAAKQQIIDDARITQQQLTDELNKANKTKEEIFKAYQVALGEANNLRGQLGDKEKEYSDSLARLQHQITSLSTDNERVNGLLQTAAQENAKFQKQVQSLSDKLGLANSYGKEYGKTLVELLGVIHSAALEGVDVATVVSKTPGVNQEKIVNLYDTLVGLNSYSFTNVMDEIYNSFDNERTEGFYSKLEEIGTAVRDKLEKAGLGEGQIESFGKVWIQIMEHSLTQQMDHGKSVLKEMKSGLGEVILFGKAHPGQTEKIIQAFQHWSELGGTHELLLGSQVNTIGLLNTYLANLAVSDLITYDMVKDLLHNPNPTTNGVPGPRTNEFIDSPLNWVGPSSGLENSVISSETGALELKKFYNIAIPKGDFIEWVKSLKHHGLEIEKGGQKLGERFVSVLSKKNTHNPFPPTTTAAQPPNINSTDVGGETTEIVNLNDETAMDVDIGDGTTTTALSTTEIDQTQPDIEMASLDKIEREAVALSEKASQMALYLTQGKEIPKNEINSIVLQYSKMARSQKFGEAGSFDEAEQVLKWLREGTMAEKQLALRTISQFFHEHVSEKIHNKQ